MKVVTLADHRNEPLRVHCAMCADRLCFAGMSDHWSVLAAQRPREPEAGENAGVEKLRDRGDLFAFEG